MVKILPKYDDRHEIKLNELVRDLDREPVLRTDPVEASSYLGIKLANSEEVLQQIIESRMNDFMEYINDFAKSCICLGAVDSILSPTISRLLTQYKQSQAVFIDSPLRVQWKEYSQNFVIPYSSKDYTKEQEQKYTRQAYSFFYKSSGVQLLFINRLVNDLAILLNRSNFGVVASSKLDSQDSVNNTEQDTSKNKCFTIRVKAKKHTHSVLNCLHKELKNGGYIECHLPEFKKVFTTVDPKPIIWLKPYNHLSYLIKRMGELFIDDPHSQSNMTVAIKLFYNKKYGTFFLPKKVRHDKNPGKNAKAFLDRAIYQSIEYFFE